MGDGITVKGPDGTIQFPAGMHPEEVEAAMAKLYPAKAPQAEVRAYKPSEWEQFKAAVPSVGHLADIVTGKTPAMSSMRPQDVTQLAYPERVFSATEQAQHPIRTGVDQVLGGLTSPENLMIMQGMGGPIPEALQRGASAVFAGQMGKGAYQTGTAAIEAYQHGDIGEAKRLGTHAVVGGALAAGAGLHAGGDELRSTAGELWRDESGTAKLLPSQRADAGTMLFRSYKKLEYSQRDFQKAMTTGDADAVDAAHKQVLKDTVEWAKWAPKEDVASTLTKLRTNLESNETQLTKTKDLIDGLVGGKLSFSNIKGGDQISRAQYKEIVGKNLPTMPEEFPSTLPERVRSYIDQLPFAQKREALIRQWGAAFATRELQGRLADHNRTSDIAATISQAKNIRPESVQSQEVLPKHAEPAQAPVRPEMGREAPTSEVAKPETASVQAAQPTEGRGEPIRTAEGPSVAETTAAMSTEDKVAMNQRIAKYVADTDRTRAAVKADVQLTADERLKQVFAQSQSVGGGESDNFTRAKAELFPGKRELSVAEIGQVSARAKEIGKEAIASVPKPTFVDEALENRIAEIMKKKPGIAEGSARMMAKYQMEQERGSFSFKRKAPQIGPQKASASWRAGDALENVANSLGAAFGDLDAVKDTERQARMITRGIDSEKKLLALQLEEKLKGAIESHDNDSKADFRAFMDAGEGKPGAAFLKPEDQIVATQLHNEFQKRWVKINDILDRDPNPGIDNYLSHIWKRPGQAQVKLDQFINTRRPLGGRTGFLKERAYQYASEGLDKGLEPLSMNPIRMQLASLFQIDKFITAHDLKDAYKDAGLAQWVKVGSRQPQGYERLSDRIFNPQTYSEKEGGLVTHGAYYAPPEVARIFNRYLDPGLSGNLAYDSIRNYGNLLNQVNLGVSGYHGSFITIVSGSSDVALGLEKVLNNRDVGGVNNILRGTIGTLSAPFDLAIQGIADKLGKTESVENLVGSSSAGRFYKRGREIQKEALSPSPGPKTREQQLLQTYVDELVKSGAAFKQDSFYRTPEGQKFFRGLVQTPYKLFTEGPKEAFKTGYATIQAGVQRFPITRGIMDYYVPRVKLGMASHMMEAKLQELVKHGVYDQDTIRTEMSKIWDSVDNRAGQMKYDNLFWNRSAKDLAFLGVRAVGWDMGTLREIGGAGVDVMSGLSKLAKGEKPSTVLTGRAAFVLGTTITLGTIGSIMTYLATGKGPQNTLDYFYPPTGRTGTNGKPERYALPTYAKDVVNFYNKPGQTIISKLHPSIEQLYEFYNNRDFQDTQIYDRGGPDPFYQKGVDILKWWGKTATPFAVTTTLARQRGGEGLGPGASRVAIALESFGGLQRAGREVSSSRAEDYIFDNAKRYWEAGPVGRQDRERRELFFQFRTQQRMGTLKDNEVTKALDSGKIHDQDFDRIYDDEGLTNVQSEFKFLASHDLPTAVKALQLMKPEERMQYQEQVEEMMGGSQYNNMTAAEQAHYDEMVDSLMGAVPK